MVNFGKQHVSFGNMLFFFKQKPTASRSRRITKTYYDQTDCCVHQRSGSVTGGFE